MAYCPLRLPAKECRRAGGNGDTSVSEFANSSRVIRRRMTLAISSPYTRLISRSAAKTLSSRRVLNLIST